MKFYKGTDQVKPAGFGTMIITPEGLQEYANKVTGFILFDDATTNSPIARNTGYGISYFSKVQSGQVRMQEVMIAIDGDNGSLLQICYTEDKNNEASNEDVMDMFYEVLASLPKKYRSLFSGARDMNYAHPTGPLGLLGNRDIEEVSEKEIEKSLATVKKLSVYGFGDTRKEAAQQAFYKAVDVFSGLNKKAGTKAKRKAAKKARKKNRK